MALNSSMYICQVIVAGALQINCGVTIIYTKASIGTFIAHVFSKEYKNYTFIITDEIDFFLDICFYVYLNIFLMSQYTMFVAVEIVPPERMSNAAGGNKLVNLLPASKYLFSANYLPLNYLSCIAMLGQHRTAACLCTPLFPVRSFTLYPVHPRECFIKAAK